MTIYTLINYVPSEDGWHDRCGDYHKGKESLLKISYFTDKFDIGQALAQAEFKNSNSENSVLINGVNPEDYLDILSVEEQNELGYELDEIYNISYKQIEILKEVKFKEDEALRIKKEQELKNRQEQERLQIEDTERKYLAQLLHKYKS